MYRILLLYLSAPIVGVITAIVVRCDGGIVPAAIIRKRQSNPLGARRAPGPASHLLGLPRPSVRSQQAERGWVTTCCGEGPGGRTLGMGTRALPKDRRVGRIMPAM